MALQISFVTSFLLFFLGLSTGASIIRRLNAYTFIGGDYFTGDYRASNTPGTSEYCYVNTNETEMPDAPCIVSHNAEIACEYNMTAQEWLDVTQSQNYERLVQADSATIQECLCRGDGSVYFDSMSGCSECHRLHGMPIESDVPVPYISALSSTYCALPKPSMTEPFVSYASSWMQSALAATAVPLSTYSYGADTLGSQTAVSLYYTAATDVSYPYPTSGTASRPSVGLIGGLIMVALAVLGVI